MTTRVPVLCLLALLAGSVCTASAQTSDPTPSQLASGQRLFDRQCARCHGIGGTGGDGPALARPRLRRAADDESLFNVIKGGIPGTGMPFTWQMSDEEIGHVVAYVRSLGRTAEVALAGDPASGQTVYSDNACARCHIVDGQGTGLGPELSEIGAMRGPEHLRESLIDPDASLPSGDLIGLSPVGFTGYLPVRVVTHSGEEVQGVRINEDTFTIQIRDLSGNMHSYRKHDLRSIEHQFDHSVMPSYQDQLMAEQLDDLVAYLAGLRGDL